jgi:hypothetical protein
MSVIICVEGTTFNITRSCVLSTESVYGFHVSLRIHSSNFASAVTRFIVLSVHYELTVVHSFDKFRTSNVVLS